jgi:hypothetical protein
MQPVQTKLEVRNLLSLVLLGLILFVALEASQRIDVPLLSRAQEWDCPLPTSAKEVADMIGGTPNQWSQTDRSWTYRGSDRLTFTVPKRCVWAVPSGYKRAGETVTLSGGETITWPESS